ncbi:hypothetical protein RIF29_40288 [Crotalaria pallida]|uniref:Uncharacterized protein n=1 Tax=Crotalaria pallida TaxID=3830 RepID=A0AAN9E5B1_CROPI
MLSPNSPLLLWGNHIFRLLMKYSVLCILFLKRLCYNNLSFPISYILNEMECLSGSLMFRYTKLSMLASRIC